MCRSVRLIKDYVISYEISKFTTPSNDFYKALNVCTADAKETLRKRVLKFCRIHLLYKGHIIIRCVFLNAYYIVWFETPITISFGKYSLDCFIELKTRGAPA